jgi:hypothetical protein
MRNALIVAAFLIAGSELTFAQSRLLASADEARKASDSIVGNVSTGNFVGALKEMKPLSVIPSAEFDAFEAQVNAQLENLLRRFGPPNAYELIREDKVGTRLVRYQYLVFHEKGPIRWTLVFYKSDKGWNINEFKFDFNSQAYFPG